ncbi:MAG TPA: hypothetical protein VN947_07955 [Polyangia bacterium]|nr:hypothetical protein [Polyangia bacterium]
MTAARPPGHFRCHSSVSPESFIDLPRQPVPPGFELGRDTPNCNIPRCGAISTFSGDYVVMPPDEVCPGPSLIFRCPRCDEEFLVAAPIWHSRLGYEW